MKYFLLGHEYPESGYIDGDVSFTPPLAGYYRVGIPLEMDGRIVSVTMDRVVRKLKADFFLTTSGAFFASEELSALLKSVQPDLHFFPSETRYASGKPTEKRYLLVHADRQLPAFDYQRSQYGGRELVLRRLERGEDPDDFLVKSVRIIAIDAECATGQHFFFLKNVLLVDPIVSGDLAHTIRNRSLNVRLMPLDHDQSCG